MNRPAKDVLDYAAPTAVQARWPFFLGGVAVGELLSLVLLSVLQAGGPIFPFTVAFAPLAVGVEIARSDRAFYLSLFVGGPLLYGLYALLLVLPNRFRNLCISAAVHAVCFAVTLWQRDVFSVL